MSACDRRRIALALAASNQRRPSRAEEEWLRERPFFLDDPATRSTVCSALHGCKHLRLGRTAALGPHLPSPGGAISSRKPERTSRRRREPASAPQHYVEVPNNPSIALRTCRLSLHASRLSLKEQGGVARELGFLLPAGDPKTIEHRHLKGRSGGRHVQ